MTSGALFLGVENGNFADFKMHFWGFGVPGLCRGGPGDCKRRPLKPKVATCPIPEIGSNIIAFGLPFESKLLPAVSVMEINSSGSTILYL